MNKEKIMSAIGNDTVKLFCFDSVDSTSSYLRRVLDSGENGCTVAVAKAQTQGRGRSGKTFYSPEGTGLYLSVLLHPDISFEDGFSVSSRACIAVSKAIEELTRKKTQIKWVNDLFYNGKKVCGILCEAVNDYAEKRIKSLIIGVGINISTRNFPDELKETAGSLELDADISDALAGAVASNLIGMDFGELTREETDYYRSRSAVIGKTVDYYINGVKFSARALDIDSSGGLIIKKNDGALSTLTSGEITVRVL